MRSHSFFRWIGIVILTLSFSALAAPSAANSDDNPEMNGVPSTTISQPNAPDVNSNDSSVDDASATEQSDEIDTNTIKSNTPPGTGKSPTDTKNSMLHPLFFHLQNAQCGQKVVIRLAQAKEANDQSTSDFSFGINPEANKVVSVETNKDSLTISMPACGTASGNTYDVNAVVKVPSETTTINLTADFPAGVDVSVNTEGKDPQKITAETSTVINLQP